MLKLVNIKKDYVTGDSTVQALKGIDVEFRENEFVSILGHSGCGKTTLLNIVGGLDKYTSGDLIIKGRSTKEYKDSDWDTYRNHCIGFVFQSYNLIPHQTVLSNVELALTLSGVSSEERKTRAKEALEKVGLGDQLNKKPNQLSGGQMQRVAIARALVNNPEILLADEPTGALDSDTSVQIMDLLCEIAQDRLVIMVTHNPELAEQYSTRIVKLKDGLIVSDSNPYSSEEDEQTTEPEKPSKKNKKEMKKKSMSMATALSLSFNNLLTKKMRTMLTSFAGSIGIIGIALILSLQNGVQLYIESVQREALAGYPLTIEAQAMDMSAMETMFGSSGGEYVVNHALDKVYSNSAMSSMTQAMTAGVRNNDLTKLKAYLDEHKEELKPYISDIKYKYTAPMNIYSTTLNEDGSPNKVNPSPLVDMAESFLGIGDSSSPISSLTSGISYDSVTSYYNMWTELLDNDALLDSQYECIAGTWPKNYNEVVLVVDKNNEITDLALQALGLSDPNEMMTVFNSMMAGEEYIPESKEFSYEEILNLTFRLVLTPDYYEQAEDGTWVDVREDNDKVINLINEGEEIKVVGILRPKDGSIATMTGGSVGYLHSLTEHLLVATADKQIVKDQMADTETDVFTGLPFVKEETDDKSGKTTDTDVFVKPEVSEIGTDVTSIKTSFVSMTKEEIINTIKANTTGSEQALYLETVELMLKDKLTISEKKQLGNDFKQILSMYSAEDKANMSNALGYGNIDISKVDTNMMVSFLANMKTSEKLAMLETMVTGTFSDSPANPEDPSETTEPEEEPEPEPEPLAKNYEDALELLGYSNPATPLSVNIYPVDFEAKDYITGFLKNYNNTREDDNDKIIYVDYIGMILSSVTKIIDIVSYVLIAFVAISLVVSSIMIGIITYISVLERTKEIGILRAIGASKKDISRVFNAETLIVGFVSGALGIGITLLLIIPINILLNHLTSLGAAAQLPIYGGVGLVIISMVLTLIAGIIPSRIASKKDPVIALRTE